MFSMKDIANLKEVIHNQGSWDNHTSILIEHSDSKIIKDESAIIHYAKMLSDVISIETWKMLHRAKDRSQRIFHVSIGRKFLYSW